MSVSISVFVSVSLPVSVSHAGPNALGSYLGTPWYRLVWLAAPRQASVRECFREVQGICSGKVRGALLGTCFRLSWLGGGVWLSGPSAGFWIHLPIKKSVNLKIH